MLLALVGIYATLSLSVGQRSREFAIRMAVGADPLSIASLVLKRSLLIVLGAEMLGIAGTLVLAKVLSTLLFGVKPMDPITLALVALLCGLWHWERRIYRHAQRPALIQALSCVANRSSLA